MEERLQKILARAGHGSRRSCEELISAGRVRVNGKVAGLGSKAELGRDKISVDGRPVTVSEELVYVALYKPRGILSTVSEPDGRLTVRDLVDLPGTLYPVGRLDLDSEGLILMTNDGKLAFRLAHPKYAIERVYDVGVEGKADRSLIDSLRKGVQLEDGQARAERVSLVRDGERRFTLRLTLTEGRKREVRRMVAACGFEVCKLKRVRFGSVALGQLAPGAWRHLTRDEVRGLRRLVQDAYLATGNLKRRRTGEE